MTTSVAPSAECKLSVDVVDRRTDRQRRHRLMSPFPLCVAEAELFVDEKFQKTPGKVTFFDSSCISSSCWRHAVLCVTLTDTWPVLPVLTDVLPVQGVMQVERRLGGYLLDKPKQLLFHFTAANLCVSIEDLGAGWRCKQNANYQVRHVF